MSDVPEVWSDLHQNIDVDAQGAVRKVINIDAIKTSIDNILRTSPGERVMRPTFAGGLQDLVFEPTRQDVYNRISDRIKSSINIWDPRIIVQTIGFVIDADHSEVTIEMKFAVKGYDQIFNHATTLTGV